MDADTVLIVDHIGESPQELAADEREHTATMSRARLREFVAGRAVARQGLHLLQHRRGTGIPMGAGGEPIWPRGFSGSLSHTAMHAVALIARSACHPSVGVDLDDQRLLGTTAAAELMTNDEIEVVLEQGWTRDVAIAQNLVFVAKESLFKYQYPITGMRELDFDEVHLHASEQAGVLAASCVAENPGIQDALASARLFYQEIHGLRICLALPSPSTHKMFDFRT